MAPVRTPSKKTTYAMQQVRYSGLKSQAVASAESSSEDSNNDPMLPCDSPNSKTCKQDSQSVASGVDTAIALSPLQTPTPTSTPDALVDSPSSTRPIRGKRKKRHTLANDPPIRHQLGEYRPIKLQKYDDPPRFKTNTIGKEVPLVRPPHQRFEIEKPLYLACRKRAVDALMAFVCQGNAASLSKITKSDLVWRSMTSSRQSDIVDLINDCMPNVAYVYHDNERKPAYADSWQAEELAQSILKAMRERWAY